MPTHSREKLSGSTNGLATKVVAVATAGTLIHTALTGTAGWDAIFLWVTNTSNAPVTLTIEYGGVTDPDHLILKGVSIPANSAPTLIVNGLMLQNALVVRAFAGSANVLLISGYVTRIS